MARSTSSSARVDISVARSHFNELARDGQDAERWSMLHPTEPPRQSYVTGCYGSLTSFNVLFADEADQFKGSGGQDK